MNEIIQADGNKVLEAEWSRPFMSLSGAVWWIATSGGARDCNDDELERAANCLLEAAQNGAITIYGVAKNEVENRPIPAERFAIQAMSFTGDVGDADLLFGERKETNAPPPVVLCWMSGLEDDWRNDDGDKIETRFHVLWRRISVKKAELCTTWPRIEVAREDPKAKYLPKGGGAGRPTAMPFVKEEAKRRRDMGETLPTIAAEAKHLHQWCTETHPDIDPPSQNRIETAIRFAYNAWKNSLPHN